MTPDLVAHDRGSVRPSPARRTALCTHCGLPVPRGLVVPGSDTQFCCSGCRAVHDVIAGCGLERYYDVLRSTDGERRRASTTNRAYEELDDEAFQHRAVTVDADGRCSVELYLENVHCAACLWLVERLPRVAPGVAECRLDLRRSMVRLRWDRERTTLSAAAQALDRLGYPPHPARGAGARAARRRAERTQLIRLGVAGACAGNVMLLALAMYAGLFDAMEPSYLRLFRWTSMALSAVAVLWPGSVFFRSAWAALRTRTMLLDVPIAVALAVGLSWGILNTVRGTGEVYFDSLSVLVFALLLGRYVQQRQQRWSADAVELLFALTPTRAVRLDPVGGGDSTRSTAPQLDEGASHVEQVIPIEAVERGDLLLVRAGESFPADGRLVRGASSIDRALLTGESTPVAVDVGDEVPAGAVNLTAPLTIRVDATGEDTRVGRLLRLVEDGAARRAPIVRLADRIAGWFSVTVLALALITAIAWWSTGPELALEHAIALLIVTCPCGLGLATPLALTVAVGRAARAGILITGGETIERLANGAAGGDRGLVLLDKTGTVTSGRLDVVEVEGDQGAVRRAAHAERGTTHPVAAAIVRWAEERDRSSGEDAAELPTVRDHRHVVGGGVEAIVDDRLIRIGSEAFVTGGGACPSDLRRRCDAWAANGCSPVLVAVDGRVRAAVALRDTIRPDATATVETLRRTGWRIGLLSGDDPGTVARVADEIGIDPALVRGGATPEEKLDAVERYAANGPVVMVGDGVNDAAALAAATVGVAVHGGAEASLAAADVHLAEPGLGAVARLLSGSRRAMRVVRGNLAVSLTYNVAAGGLAIGGAISPLLAAIIMPISSLTVVALSLHGRTFTVPPRTASTEDTS